MLAFIAQAKSATGQSRRFGCGVVISPVYPEEQTFAVSEGISHMGPTGDI
jgi:hypothetical protein